jgi:hypothetical protein
MENMNRSFLAAAGALTFAALAPASASATVVELGQTSTPIVAPSCPSGIPKSQCTIILTETTAVETTSDGVVYPTTVKKAGRIVAYTLGLSKLAKSDITTLNSLYGGPAQVWISVLRQGKQRFFTVKAQSKPNLIQPWFGTVAQWPLNTTIPVSAGDVVALTVPTWAPVLAINAGSKFVYRASRATGCALQATFSTQTAQLTIGDKKQYRCFYGATRVEYSATEVTNPPVPKNAVK